METVLTDIADPREREIAKRLCWEHGLLDYRRRNTQYYIKQQTEVAKRISRKIYWETTRRLGKSSELLTLFTEHCLDNPGWRAGFFAPVKEGLKDYIDPIIFKTYQDCPDSRMPDYHESRFILEFKNGSTIIFRASLLLIAIACFASFPKTKKLPVNQWICEHQKHRAADQAWTGALSKR